MPLINAPKEVEIDLQETARNTASEAPLWLKQDEAGASLPNEGEDHPISRKAGSDTDRLFSFISEAHLEEAREFRRKGHNSQIPEVDPRLVMHLREAVATAKSSLCLQASIKGPLGSRWLLEQLQQIENFTDRLSDNRVQEWVKNLVASKSNEGAEEQSLGSRSAAQSLVRRLEATLQTLIRVVYTLRAIDDHSTPEKRHDMLVAELTDAFSSSGGNTVMQAVEKMEENAKDNAAWLSLIQIRAAAWEADKSTALGSMVQTARHEAEKANKKARDLTGDSQAFFGDTAEYLQRLASHLAKAPINLNPSDSAHNIQEMNDAEVAVPSSPSNTLQQRIKTGFAVTSLKLQATVAGGEKHVRRAVRVLQYRHATQTPSKAPDNLIADSVIRSILWLWQQSAIKIQHASSALLSKVDELQKIKGMLLPNALAYGRGNEQEGSDIWVRQAGEDDMDALIRQWVHDRLEQEKPENQLIAKVAVLEKLLGNDIDHAQTLLARLGHTPEDIEKRLKNQLYSVTEIRRKRLSADAAKFLYLTVEYMNAQFMPDIARELGIATKALNKALLAAGSSERDFSKAKAQAEKAQLQATKVKEQISVKSARLTDRPLDENSRGSRLAKHWAGIAKEQNLSDFTPQNVKQVLSSLKKNELLEGVVSTGDPEGYLFATRLADELENARNDELILPMSPEQYTALEKGLVEYIVKWGQKRVSHGVARIIIELSFEEALDAVTFKFSSLVRLPYKILKASIKIPFKVNEVNNFTMPGQDKPYKAIYGLLEKKLKQLGFSLITTPIPSVVKLAIGTGMTAGAALYNEFTDNKEKAFIAVYERVAEGKKSEKVKMNSIGGALFDFSTDAGFMATSAVIHQGWHKPAVGFDEDKIQKYISDFENDPFLQSLFKQLDDGNNTSALAKTDVNESEFGAVNHSSSLKQQKESGTSSERGDPTSEKILVRRRRDGLSTPNNPGTFTEKSELNFSGNYKDFTLQQKESSYFYAIQFALYKIKNDSSLPEAIRVRANVARAGLPILVPVDIFWNKLNNKLFLPESDGSKKGILINLDSEKLYYPIDENERRLMGFEWAMPHNYDRPIWGVTYDIRPSGASVIHEIRSGNMKLGYFFNWYQPKPQNVKSISKEMADTMENDYKLKGIAITNKTLISRAIEGAQLPEQQEKINAMENKITLTLADLMAAEYLRSLARPFSTLGEQVQLITSTIKKESIQETEAAAPKAEYIGSWLDATLGAVTSVSPAGWVLNSAQSLAGILADVVEGKEPDHLAVAALVVSCIPGGKIAAKVGKFSHTGSKVVKHGLMLGNKTIDLAMVGSSIQTAIETGDSLDIYKALLASGMSAENSYRIARNMTSTINKNNEIKGGIYLNKLRQNARIQQELAENVESASRDFSQTSVNPEDSHELTVYEGPSSRRLEGFNVMTYHNVYLNTATKFILKRKYAGIRIQEFDPKSSKFKKSEGFSVANSDIANKGVNKKISPQKLLDSLKDMGYRADELMNHLKHYKGPDRDDVYANLKLITKIVEQIETNLRRDNSDTEDDYYVLTREGSDVEDIRNHYALAELQMSIDEKKLRLSNLMAHPYVVINKFPEFKEYLIARNVKFKAALEKYNIKNVARYLGAKAIKSEIGYYDDIPEAKVDVFTFNGANPVTQRFGYALEIFSKYFTRQRSDASEIDDMEAFIQSPRPLQVPPSRLGLFSRPPPEPEANKEPKEIRDRINYLKSQVRTDFAYVKPIEALPDEKVENFIEKQMKTLGAEIISNDISESRVSSDVEIKDFSEKLIASINRSYDKVASVKRLFDLAESQPEIKKKLKSLIDEATGLKDEVILKIDMVEITDMSELAYDKFKEKVFKLHAYLLEQKENNYKAYVLFKFKSPQASNEPPPDAFALPHDRKKRIFIAMLPKNQRKGSLSTLVTHEASHNAAGTLDLTYMHKARDASGSLPSTFDESARDPRVFYENERVAENSMKHALGIAENAKLNETDKRLATLFLYFSKLMRADALLSTAEYNSYMVDVLSRTKLDDSSKEEDSTFEPEPSTSRGKRSVTEIDHEFDSMIMRATMRAAMTEFQSTSLGHIESEPGDTDIYETKSGDTLRKIANTYYGNKDISPVIHALNKNEIGNAQKIPSGIKLNIPTLVYIVQSGDTLKSIAKKLYRHEALSSILNELNKDALDAEGNLHEGKKLKLPKFIYTVKSGDTLVKISKKYYGHGMPHIFIYNANKNIISNPRVIYTGQKLIIPL